MTNQSGDAEFAAVVLDACVSHARQVLALQMQRVENQYYDLMPYLKEMTIQLYLAGVMWRFGEQFDLPTPPRDRSFICLLSMLVGDGMTYKKAQERIAYLNKISCSADGRDNLAIATGYGASDGDGSLARILGHFASLPEASGAPSRFMAQAKPISAVLAATAFAASKLLGSSWLSAIIIGVVIGIVALGIAVIIHSHMTKPKK